MIREAIEVYIESLVAHGDPIPGPVEIERVIVASDAGPPGPHATASANPTLGQPSSPQQAGFSLRPCPAAPIASVFESSV